MPTPGNSGLDNHIHFVPFNPSKNPELIPSLVSCYQECFATEPWREWMKCSGKCNHHWGKEDEVMLKENGFRCLRCHAPLIPFWPTEKVEGDIRTEIGPDASCWLAVNGDKVIGFCWGYPTTPAHLEEKLGIALMGAISDHFGYQEKVAYQDEIGVLEAWRERKIAKAMFKKRLSDFLAQKLKIGIIRTREAPQPSKTFLWYTKKLGYQVIARYPVGDGRVILGRSLHGLQELL